MSFGKNPCRWSLQKSQGCGLDRDWGWHPSMTRKMLVEMKQHCNNFHDIAGSCRRKWCNFVIGGIVVSCLLHQEWVVILWCDTGVILVGQIFQHHFCPWKLLRDSVEWGKLSIYHPLHLSLSTSFLWYCTFCFLMNPSYIGWFLNKVYCTTLL